MRKINMLNDDIRKIIRSVISESIEEQNFIDLSFADENTEDKNDDEVEVNVVASDVDDDSDDDSDDLDEKVANLEEELEDNITVSDPNGISLEISPESVDPDRPESLESVLKSVLYMLNISSIKDMSKDLAKDYDLDQISVQMILHKLLLNDEMLKMASRALADLVRYTRENERASD
jgi:hypothetical protein